MEEIFDTEVTVMGLFDVFSKGGKYFGKSIEPRCEYCEHGKRAKDGDKVLCSRKGLVNSGDHCPKFTYSPLKRIPVKQMKMVGFLEGDYDEKNFDDEDNTAKPNDAKKGGASKSKQEPKPETKQAEQPAVPVAEQKQEAPVAAAPVISDDLAALAAAAEAAGDYAPEAVPAAAEAADDLAALAAAADAADSNVDSSALSAM